MKILLSFILLTFLNIGFGQDDRVEEKYEEDNIPQKGIKPVPELQEDSSIPNPFPVGPYKNGEYQYVQPNEASGDE